MDLLLFLGPAFLICLILTGIHCYLGLHILTRNIVFVDLALAQAGAFGLAFSLLIGWEHDSIKTYFAVLSACLTASALFTLISAYKKQISQEAFIGIVYAFFSALVILLLDKSPHGSEHIKQTLTGHLIWVSWGSSLKIFLIYAGVSFFYFIFHKQIWKNSIGKSNHWQWNLLFYILFSIIIASSVSLVGVLLVFAFLIAPSFLSAFFFQSFLHRLIFGWITASILSLLGLSGSYLFNLPTSAFLVFLFTSLPILFLLMSSIKKLQPKKSS